MVAYRRDEIISITDLARNLSTSINGLLEYSKEKLAISKNNRLEAVIIPIDEYERLKEAYEYIEEMEISNIIRDRDKTDKKEYIELEDLAKEYGVNLDEL